MPRSRSALLAAWALLALGVVVSQFGGSDDSTGGNRPGSDPVGGETADDRAGEDDAPLRSADTGSLHGETDRPTVAGLGAPPADPPIRSGARVMASTVATVIGDGVASLSDPGDGDPVFWFANPTEFGGDRTFLVVDGTSSADYVKVSLPVMPNGQEGWLPRSEVELSTVTHRAEVDLSDFTVTVWDGPEVLVTTGAITGRPTAPTPIGTFYVRDVIAQANPSGDYGPWILALSGFSETLTTFNGGLPALALHGTDESERIGTAISAGCVRVPNEVITLLARTVPLGTPVTVVA